MDLLSARMPPDLAKFLYEMQKRPIYMPPSPSAINESREFFPKIQLPKDFKTLSDEALARQFASFLFLYGPFTIMVQFGPIVQHIMVVKGVYNNRVIIHDPWYGPEQIYNIKRLVHSICDNTIQVYFMEMKHQINLAELYTEHYNHLKKIA